MFDRVSSRRFEGPRWTAIDLSEVPPVLAEEMLPLLRKSERHPDFTSPEAFESLAIFWQMQTRRGILQFCSTECEMSELSAACNAGDEALRTFLKTKTTPHHTHYVAAYTTGIWPLVYKVMREMGLPMVSLDRANRLDGREREVVQ